MKPSRKCNICGWVGEIFLPYGLNPKPDRRCPDCASLERHRLAAEILRSEKLLNGFAVLHVAPEKGLGGLLQKSFTKYISVDKEEGRATSKQDLMKLDFEDVTFDLVVCSHVLEHVKDDMKALREIHRVLRPQGKALIQVPISFDREGQETDTPAERRAFYGHKDHRRAYSLLSFQYKLRDVGFYIEPCEKPACSVAFRLGNIEGTFLVERGK